MKPRPIKFSNVMGRSVRLLFAAVCAVGLLVICQLRPALAHPLGNFSINHYGAIRIEPERIELHYVIDMAEIPTFQELQENQIVADARHPTRDNYLRTKAEALKKNLRLEINGRPLALDAVAKQIVFPEGAGGLPTLRLAITYAAAVKMQDSSLRLQYVDANYPERMGWKEVIVQAGASIKVLQSSVPDRDRSGGLSNYPADLLNSPPQDLAADIIFSRATPVTRSAQVANFGPADVQSEVRSRLNSTVTANRAETPVALSSDRESSASPPKTAVIGTPLQANLPLTPRDRFTQLMTAEHWSSAMLVFALAVAAGLGALHALEPGHGKTLVAAYLVGSRGTMKHALWLGLIVTASHTAGVYLLGVITLYASRYVVPEKLYPWLTLLSGLTIAGLGCALLVSRVIKRGSTHHEHSDHVHHHDGGHTHSHYHGHHHHAPEKKVSVKQLLALGISGGVVPCPAALVVLLSAISLQRVGLGLLLIVAFSAGLAAVLIVIGMLVVQAKTVAVRFNVGGAWTTRWLPLTSSAFIVMFGLALTWQAFQSAGLKLFSIL